MVATTREINVVRMEHLNNEEWQELVDMLCANKRTLSILWREYKHLMAGPILSRIFVRLFPAMARFVNISMKRMCEEAVRRGLLPEQNFECERKKVGDPRRGPPTNGKG